MNCPSCNADFSHVLVLESRPTPHYIRRRRRCNECDHRWTTIEMTPPQGMLVGGNWSNSSFQRRFVLMPQHEVEAIRQTVDVAFKRLLALGETIESLCDFEP